MGLGSKKKPPENGRFWSLVPFTRAKNLGYLFLTHSYVGLGERSKPLPGVHLSIWFCFVSLGGGERVAAEAKLCPGIFGSDRQVCDPLERINFEPLEEGGRAVFGVETPRQSRDPSWDI